MSKKTFMATVITAAFLVSIVAGVQTVKADSNGSITFPWGLTINSPVNATYYSSSPLLDFALSCVTGVSSVRLNCTLDGIYPVNMTWGHQQSISDPLKLILLGSSSLPQLSDGSHQLSVGIEEFAPFVSRSDLPADIPFQLAQPTTSNETPEFVASWIDTVYFTIDTIDSPPPTPTPTPTPTSTLIAAIQSPLNQTYTTDTVTVNVTAYDISQAIAGISYALDVNYEPNWVGSVTIYTNEPRGGIFSHEGNGTSTLSNLSNGQHHLIVTVREWMIPRGYSDIKMDVYFSVQKPTSEPSPSPTPTPKPTPTLAPTPSPSKSSYSSHGNSNVSISILSPENKTYATTNIELAVSAQANPGLWNLLYSMDGGPLIDFTPQNWTLPHTYNGSIWLNGLSEGSHNIVAQTYTFAGNQVGSINSTSQVYFTIAPVLASSFSSPTQKPTIESSSTPVDGPYTGEPDLGWIPYAIIAVIVIIAVAALIYYNKRKG